MSSLHSGFEELLGYNPFALLVMIWGPCLSRSKNTRRIFMVRICVGSSFQVRYEKQLQHPCVDLRSCLVGHCVRIKGGCPYPPIPFLTGGLGGSHYFTPVTCRSPALTSVASFSVCLQVMWRPGCWAAHTPVKDAWRFFEDLPGALSAMMTWTCPWPTWFVRSWGVAPLYPYSRVPTLAMDQGLCGQRPFAVWAMNHCCSIARGSLDTSVTMIEMLH